MNIYVRELRAHRTSLIIWCIGVFYMVAASMWKFGTEYSSNQSLNELVSQLPAMVRVLLGIRGTFDLSTAEGYYGLSFYFLILIGMIHASITGSGLISKEERDKTTEFLIAKPVSRNTIISAKLLAGFTNILVFNLVTTISSILMVGYFNNGEVFTGDIIKLMIGMFFLQLIFMLVGTGIAAVSPKTASTGSIVVLLVCLALAKVVDMSSQLEVLKYFTPIKYFEAEQILLYGGFKPVFMILTILIIISLLNVTFIFYKRRDLKV